MDQVLQSGQMVTLVHFVQEMPAPPTDKQPEGPPILSWRIVCMPNMEELHQTQYHPAYQRTNESRAVTCPACKKTSLFKAARAMYRE